MELYGLDCVDLVVSYTIQFLFVAKKCKFSENKTTKKKKITYIPPSPAASNRYGLLRKEKKTYVKRKGLFKSKTTLNYTEKNMSVAFCW